MNHHQPITIANLQHALAVFSEPVATISQPNMEYQCDLIRLAIEALERRWRPIETAPKDGLMDILIDGKIRWCDCYYDRICDQWRTSRPSGHLVWVSARTVTHWMISPEPACPSSSEMQT
jgi:hypothetical protein